MKFYRNIIHKFFGFAFVAIHCAAFWWMEQKNTWICRLKKNNKFVFFFNANPTNRFLWLNSLVDFAFWMEKIKNKIELNCGKFLWWVSITKTAKRQKRLDFQTTELVDMLASCRTAKSFNKAATFFDLNYHSRVS